MVTDELTTDLLQQALRAGVKDVLPGAGRDRRSWPKPCRRVAASLTSCAGARPHRSSRRRRRRRARPGHHRVLHQGRRRQVGHRHQPGRRAGQAQRASRSCSSTPTCSSATSPSCSSWRRSTRSSTRSARSTASTPRCSQSLLVRARALGPAGAARSARAGVRRPDRRRRDGAASSRCCARSARYVVIDTPAYFNDVVLGLIEDSDDVLLVAGHGHPEHQEREDRPADAAPAQHADGEAPARPQPGQLQGEARRGRGRAHARRSRPSALDPERRRRAAVGQQGRRRSCSTPRSPGVAKSIEQLADLFVAVRRRADVAQR